MKRWLMIVAICGALLAPMQTAADDPPGCDGLAQFSADISLIGQQWRSELDAAGLGPERDIETYSSDDWTAMADAALNTNRALKAIDAPDWAKPWMGIHIESTGLMEQIGRVAAVGGIIATIAFTEQVTELDHRDEIFTTIVTKRCPAFAGFLNGEYTPGDEIDGAPVATPVH